MRALAHLLSDLIFRGTGSNVPRTCVGAATAAIALVLGCAAAPAPVADVSALLDPAATLPGGETTMPDHMLKLAPELRDRIAAEPEGMFTVDIDLDPGPEAREITRARDHFKPKPHETTRLKELERLIGQIAFETPLADGDAILELEPLNREYMAIRTAVAERREAVWEDTLRRSREHGRQVGLRALGIIRHIDGVDVSSLDFDEDIAGLVIDRVTSNARAIEAMARLPIVTRITPTTNGQTGLYHSTRAVQVTDYGKAIANNGAAAVGVLDTGDGRTAPALRLRR